MRHEVELQKMLMRGFEGLTKASNYFHSMGLARSNYSYLIMEDSATALPF